MSMVVKQFKGHWKQALVFLFASFALFCVFTELLFEERKYSWIDGMPKRVRIVRLLRRSPRTASDDIDSKRRTV